MQYDQYYVQCAPKRCSYTISVGSNPVYVFTRVIGLIGGLTAVLRVLVRIVVGWIRNRMKHTSSTNDRRSK